MHLCSNLPLYNKTCNLTYEQAQEQNSNGCVNWNQYYTNCIEGGQNPFQGTISFDNIGLAWVAIFLVSDTNLIFIILKRGFVLLLFFDLPICN